MQALIENVKEFSSSDRFRRNFFPIPATCSLRIGQLAPDFTLPDVTRDRTIKLSDYRNKQPVILAFTRIFNERTYCPLCYPHIRELNERYEELTETGAELLMITSTDAQQSQQIIKDLSLKIPLLSNPTCEVFRTYEVGQALGAPLPAQFVLDCQGRVHYKHLFSFLDPNASIEKLLAAVGTLSESEPDFASSQLAE